MDNINALTEVVFSTSMITFIKIMFSITLSLILKDIAVKMSSGLMFYLDKNFNEGDTVYIDDKKATIVKIGLLETVFMVTNDNGEILWRYISNDRIKFTKLEKPIVKG